MNSSLRFKISYNSSSDGKQKTIESSNNIQELSQNEDQILLDDIQTTKTQNRIQSFDISSVGKNQFDLTAHDSYLIVCYSSEPNCEPILISKYGISCDCEVTDQMATILIVMFFWFICCLTAIKPIFSYMTDRGKNERTDFPMTISCSQKNAKYEYVIGIRVAKTTSDFDLTNVNVDIEFMSDTNESVGRGLCHLCHFKLIS